MSLKDKVLKDVRRVFAGGVNIEKLKKTGLIVGNDCWFGNGVFIDPTFCCLIRIGNNCTITSNAHILAHDASTKKALGYTKIGQVCIGNSVFIGANVTILPNVKIGDNSIIAAGAIVTKDVPANEVWGDNPAKFICTLEDYTEKHRQQEFLLQDAFQLLSEKDRVKKLQEITNKGIAYIE